MHIEEIRAALHRMPFMPFIMQLADGTTRHVPHRDFIALGNRRSVVAIDPTTDAASFIDPLMVVALEFAQTPAASTPAGRNGEHE